jgi:hypothetical protein
MLHIFLDMKHQVLLTVAHTKKNIPDSFPSDKMKVKNKIPVFFKPKKKSNTTNIKNPVAII